MVLLPECVHMGHYTSPELYFFPVKLSQVQTGMRKLRHRVVKRIVLDHKVMQ